MRHTIAFFETRGKRKLTDDDHARTWCADFLAFQQQERLFATLLTPPAYGEDECRWDSWRNFEFNEILAFYGLAYWYPWQVSILGLGPLWMSQQEALKRRAARLLQERLLIDAYTRRVAMKLFALRALDYMRAASLGDRHYLLYNTIVNMKVTTQGEDVINLLADVIAAKGFEKDTYFAIAARDIRALPKLEGTVHVNLALMAKFMVN